MTANLIENLKLVATMAVNSNEPVQAMAAFEKFVIETQLRKRAWNQSHAAKVLRMHRNTLSRKMAEHGIVVPPEYRSQGGPSGEESRAA